MWFTWTVLDRVQKIVGSGVKGLGLRVQSCSLGCEFFRECCAAQVIVPPTKKTAAEEPPVA